MGKLPDVSETKKQAIIALIRSKSLTTREISEQEMVSMRTVFRIKKKMLEGRAAVNGRVQECGRKKKTSKVTDRFIQRQFLKNPFKSPFQLANELAAAGSLVSHMTIRRRLKEYGFRSCRPAKKPRLTKSMREKRLAWAREHSSWTMEDWSKVRHFSIICYIMIQSICTCILQETITELTHLKFIFDSVSYH